MDRETASALCAINRSFYREVAAAFSRTREDPWPGWERLLEILEARPPPGPLRVLDVGCGNARFAAFLDARLRERGERFHYTGLDASEPLLERARSRRLGCGSARFEAADVVQTPPERALPSGPFSLVVLFGLLHHVPGETRRRALLEAAARRLAPGGLLAWNAWEFESQRRFRERVVAWPEYNRGAARPVDPAQLEPGDRLLRWGEPGSGRVRYCHFADEAESDRLAAGLGLERVAAFRADGREGDLNRYLVLGAGSRALKPGTRGGRLEQPAPSPARSSD